MKQESRSMQATDLSSSRVWLGTMTFGAQVDAAAAASMVDYCLERGFNFIDTANAYNAGESESIVGKLLQGRRDQVVVATKVGLPMGNDPNDRGLSRAAINKAIEDSLRRLRTDYVDLYYLHQPDYSVPIEESLESMQRLVEAGKVRAVGASNYASWQVCQMLCLAKQNGWTPISAVQPMYNLLARGIEQEFLPMSREFALAVIAYNPLAGGLLTGKHQPEAPCRARALSACPRIATATGMRRTSPPSTNCPGWQNRPAARWPAWRWAGSCTIAGSPA